MSGVCFSCLHNMHAGVCRKMIHSRAGSYECLCPDGVTAPSGMVQIKIPEDVWQFFSETSHGRGEQAVATTLRAVMGLFS